MGVITLVLSYLLSALVIWGKSAEEYLMSEGYLETNKRVNHLSRFVFKQTYTKYEIPIKIKK